MELFLLSSELSETMTASDGVTPNLLNLSPADEESL